MRVYFRDMIQFSSVVLLTPRRAFFIQHVPPPSSLNLALRLLLSNNCLLELNTRAHATVKTTEEPAIRKTELSGNPEHRPTGRGTGILDQVRHHPVKLLGHARQPELLIQMQSISLESQVKQQKTGRQVQRHRDTLAVALSVLQPVLLGKCRKLLLLLLEKTKSLLRATVLVRVPREAELHHRSVHHLIVQGKHVGKREEKCGELRRGEKDKNPIYLKIKNQFFIF